ncbi:MAG: SGNH/GDSL hydrolase family protein, partial [Nitrospira sp.]|nr:SGNH/GDSL hydrolase family protein [Nitrospira sp.]
MALSSGRQNMMMGLLVSLSVLLLAEAVARIAKTIDLDLASTTTLAAAEGFAYSSELGWERKPGFAGIAAGGHHREFDVAGYVASDSQQVADTTHTKVLFIGDSNTFGYGVSTNDVFVEVVEQRLPDIYAINLGVIGYTSYQGRMVFEKYASLLKPDLVVVSFNYNDRRAVLEPGSVDSADTFQRMYRTRSSIGATVSGILDASYFVRALRRVMRGAGLIVGVKVDPVDVWEPRVSEESYRLNLS